MPSDRDPTLDLDPVEYADMVQVFDIYGQVREGGDWFHIDTYWSWPDAITYGRQHAIDLRCTTAVVVHYEPVGV